MNDSLVSLDSLGDLGSLISLGSLTDEQNMWLTQVSYVNLTTEGRELLLNGEIKISDLKKYIVITKDSEKIVDKLIEIGLGDIVITESSEEKSYTTSGFQALTFKDSFGNTGISYRGSDFEFDHGALDDWLNANVGEFFTNDSKQIHEALAYFEKNKNENGKTFLYGHSLGGNLTSHVFLKHFDEIEQAFVINPNLINESLIDTPEEITAFNNPDKFKCNIICGDIVSHIKSCNIYKDNITYIHNSNPKSSNVISAHYVDSAVIDENGSFSEIQSEEELVENVQVYKNSFMLFYQLCIKALNELLKYTYGSKKGEVLNDLEKFHSNFQDIFKRYNYGMLPLNNYIIGVEMGKIFNSSKEAIIIENKDKILEIIEENNEMKR